LDLKLLYSVDAFDLKIHEKITKDALPFLKENILNDIEEGQFFSDTAMQFRSAQHFDNCYFEEGTNLINSIYKNLIGYTPGKKAKEFGRIIHAAQDLYSHSNWIESGRSDLIDPSRDKLWTILHPFSIYNNILIIEGEDKNAKTKGYKLSVKNKIVIATDKSGTYKGLISGIIPYSLDKCPDSISIGHWKLGSGKSLAKDKPNPSDKTVPSLHERAVKLAIAQTKNEWCRLVNFVNEKEGQAGVERLYRNWVEDTYKANNAECYKYVWQGSYEYFKSGLNRAGNTTERTLNTATFAFETAGSGKSFETAGSGKSLSDEYIYGKGNGNNQYIGGWSYRPNEFCIGNSQFEFQVSGLINGSKNGIFVGFDDHSPEIPDCPFPDSRRYITNDFYFGIEKLYPECLDHAFGSGYGYPCDLYLDTKLPSKGSSVKYKAYSAGSYFIPFDTSEITYHFKVADFEENFVIKISNVCNNSNPKYKTTDIGQNNIKSKKIQEQQVLITTTNLDVKCFENKIPGSVS